MGTQRKTGSIPIITPQKQIWSWLIKYRAAFLVFICALGITFPYQDDFDIESYPAEGQVSKETVIAPYLFDIKRSEEEIDAARIEIENRVIPVFSPDTTSLKRMVVELDSLLVSLKTLSDTTIPDTIRTPLENSLLKEFSKEDLEALQSSPLLLQSIRKQLVKIGKSGIISHTILVDDIAVDKFVQEYGTNMPYIKTSALFLVLLDVDNASEKMVSSNSFFTLPQVYQTLGTSIPDDAPQKRRLSSAVFHVAKKCVKPTLVYRSLETRRRLKEDVSQIKLVKQTVLKDVEIVRKHQFVTPEIAEMLTALHQEKLARSSDSPLGNKLLIFAVPFALILLVAMMIVLFVEAYTPNRMPKERYFLAFASIIAVQLCIVRGGEVLLEYFSAQDMADTINVAKLAYGAIPLVVAPLLASILFNKQSGFYAALFMSIYIGIITDFDLINSIGSLITGALAAYISDTLRYRKDFIWLVFWLIVVNTGSDLLAVVGGYGWAETNIVLVFLYAVVDAALSVLIVMLLLPIFENAFDLTTNMTLLELADMNHPLLKKLAIEAPGTYNHSIIVANLAESAAASIGADALLCRVACYYHDIGKSKKPLHFIENQRFRKNVHDKLPPAMSARFISGHVRDGLKMAEKYRLPRAVKDAITQHHGDALISFFYQKACEEKKENEEIDEREYHYGGPKPQTKEMAIIMIADSMEAISRTLKSATTGELRDIAMKIARDKIALGQLDECGLTFSELTGVVNGFMPVLEGIFHSRIEYPDSNIDDGESEK